MKEIVIKVDDKQYERIVSASNKRNRSPSGLAKHMLLQVADNDEIEEVTGKRRSDYSVVKKQRYNNQHKKGRKNNEKIIY